MQEKLKHLNIYKSTRPDLLHPRILQTLEDSLSAPLTYIFNSSAETGIIPVDWKSANVTAIHKKGSIQEPGNYRPISLTSVVCKTMGRLVKERLITHLEGDNLIGDSQHGFRNKHSCLTSLLDFFAQVIDTYDTDNNKAVDLVYFDFHKAFDKVPHQRIMAKVNAHGIQGDADRWITSWLAGCRQRVCINQTTSDWTPITSGVPQGSVLGPLLFLIYINDLDNNIISKISKFADDTKLCHRARHPEDIIELQEDINKLEDWANKWKMKFNVDKCAVIHIGHNNTNGNYTMTNQQQRDLGIIITKDLKWQQQTEKSCKTADRVLGFIASNFKYKNKERMLPLYKSLIRPHLEYAVQFWSPHLQRYIIKMAKIQRKASKMIPEIRNHSYSQWLKDLNLISLEQIRLRGQLNEVFKYLGRFSNARARGLFDRDFNDRTRNNGEKLILKRFNTSIAIISTPSR